MIRNFSFDDSRFDLFIFKKVLVRIWSIAVAFVLVALVGLLIRGIRLF